LLNALDRHLPQDRDGRPEVALHLGAASEGARTEELLTLAVAQKVDVVPGKPFFAKAAAARVLRLNFSINRASTSKSE